MTTVCDVRQASARLGTCGALLANDWQSEQSGAFAILRPVFSELWSVFDHYITRVGYEDVPWWYTERSIVGLLTAAAFQAGYCSLEEFSWKRGQDQAKGRVDWWLGTGDRESEVFAETKQTYISSAGSWAKLDHGLTEAERQLLSFELGPKTNESHRLVMVFVRPYFAAPADWEEQRHLWLDACPDGVDYCVYYWLKEQLHNVCEHNGLCYPGLLICCKEV